MGLSSFPSVISSYSVIKTPQFDTRIIGYGGKTEQRISMQDDPRHTLKLKFEILIPSDLDLIEAFFRTCKGAYTAFYLPAPDEVYRSKIWAANTAYTANQIVRPTIVNGHSYKCTTAGTSHATTEPTWTTTINGTNSDGTVTWTENTYTVRFKEDVINLDYFTYNLYNLGEIEFIEVAA